MPLPPTYNVGTVSVSAGGSIVTGTDTLFVGSGVRAGDVFELAGLSVTIASVESNTQLTLVKPWPGPAATASLYEVRYVSDAARVLSNARAAIDLFEGFGNVRTDLDEALETAKSATPYVSLAAATTAASTAPSTVRLISAIVSGVEVRWLRQVGGTELGGGWVLADGFRVPSSTVIARPVVQRLRDAVSALDLMSSGGLDQAVRNREATSSDRAEINGNVQEALAACASRGWRLNMPSGDYYLSAVSAAAPVQIVGDGSADTNLYCNAGGISINSGTSTRQSSVRGLRVCAQSAALGSAVHFDHGDSFGLAANRTSPRVLVDDLQTDQTGTGYWSKGLVLRNCMQARIRGHSHRGFLLDSALPEASWTGTALSIEGDTLHQPAQVFASMLNYTAIHTAIRSVECEGVYISQFEMPTCWKGLVWNNDSVNTGNSALVLSDGHFNSRMGSIDLTNVTDYRITQIFHYLRNTPGADLSLVTIRGGCNRGQIHANLYRYATTAAEVIAIDVLGGNWLDIYNEQFDIGSTGRAIRIGAAATNTDIGVNKYITGLRVQDASTSTTYQERYGYSGSLNDIALQPRRSVQTHHLVTGASALPTGASAAGAAVVTTSQGATQGMQTLYPASDDRIYSRRYTGGAWTPWRFVAVSGVPA